MKGKCLSGFLILLLAIGVVWNAYAATWIQVNDDISPIKLDMDSTTTAPYWTSVSFDLGFPYTVLSAYAVFNFSDDGDPGVPVAAGSRPILTEYVPGDFSSEMQYWNGIPTGTITYWDWTRNSYQYFQNETEYGVITLNGALLGTVEFPHFINYESLGSLDVDEILETSAAFGYDFRYLTQTIRSTSGTWGDVSVRVDLPPAAPAALDDLGQDGIITFSIMPYTGGFPTTMAWDFIFTGATLYVEIDPDTDGDGVLDITPDNCRLVPNSDQSDYDGDGEGDACDSDDDNDGVLDATDNCHFTPNTEQADADLDLIGDLCDPDDDNDGVDDTVDNCQFDPNPDQSNIDGDAFGDVCDIDPDGDGVYPDDNCPMSPNPLQEDNESDGLGDACDPDDDNDNITDEADNCPTEFNDDQADLDADLIGDACDNDIDGDGIINTSDNCVLIPNVGQENTDYDLFGDACDDDDDNDGVLDADDNCSLIYNVDQLDSDGDGQGDVCDGDADGDGIDNEVDNCPATANGSQNDWDADGQGDVCDDDIDGDGATNADDECEFTQPFQVVDPATGCGIDQLVPCEGPRGTTDAWKNHGQFISSQAQTTKYFVENGLISQEERQDILTSAELSGCGK